MLGYWRQERPLLATSRTSRYTYQSQLQGHVALFDRHCWKLRLLGHDETEKCFSRMDGIGFLRSESLEFREKVNSVLQICKGPFFWNFKQMWEEKTMGKRQHHCRKCGKALCQKCASNQIVMPKLGFEFSPVRVCKACFDSVSDADKTPLAEKISFNRQVESQF